MTSEKDWMKQVPSEFTKVYHNSLGSRAPGDGQEEPHEAPLPDHHLTHGHDEARIPKNHRGEALVPKNRNDIKFIKGNVHISKHILQKLVKQNAYMKEIGMEAHPTNFSESHFPGMHEMGAEEKEWFMEYQKRHKKAKENMETGDYHILEEIGLLDDIPGALCVIASLKPGVHEEGQAILSHYFHVPLTGGHKPKDVKANNGLKRSYEVVEKVVLDAIDKCRTKLGKSVEKNGFIEVARFIDHLIALYVPLKRVKHWFDFDKKLVRNLKDLSFSPDQLKLKTAQDHLNTHIGASFSVGNRLLEEIIEQVRTPESRNHYKAPEVAVSDL